MTEMLAGMIPDFGLSNPEQLRETRILSQKKADRRMNSRLVIKIATSDCGILELKMSESPMVELKMSKPPRRAR